MNVRLLVVKTEKPYGRAGLRHEAGTSYFLMPGQTLSKEQMSELAKSCAGLRSEEISKEQVKEIKRDKPASPLLVVEETVTVADESKAAGKKD